MTPLEAAQAAERGELAAALLAQPIGLLDQLSLQLSHSITLSTELGAALNHIARTARAVRR